MQYTLQTLGKYLTADVVLDLTGKEAESHQPLWFEKRTDTETRESSYMYKGGYWEAKDRQDWSQCPAIF